MLGYGSAGYHGFRAIGHESPNHLRVANGPGWLVDLRGCTFCRASAPAIRMSRSPGDAYHGVEDAVTMWSSCHRATSEERRRVHLGIARGRRRNRALRERVDSTQARNLPNTPFTDPGILSDDVYR